jgi:hypothetical protein
VKFNSKAICALLAAVLLLPGCTAVRFDNYGVTGSGEIKTAEYPAGDFTKLNIGISGSLYYTVGESDTIRIETYESHIEHIEVNNRGGVLEISSERRIGTGHPDETSGQYPKIYVTAPTLEELDIYGGVNVSNMDKIVGEKFSLFVGGAVGGDIEMDVQELDVIVNGASGLELSGRAERASIINAGAGAIEAYGLETVNAEVSVEGVGAVEITCSGTLDARLEGMGAITYRGDCVVNEEIDGLGAISKG